MTLARRSHSCRGMGLPASWWLLMQLSCVHVLVSPEGGEGPCHVRSLSVWVMLLWVCIVQVASGRLQLHSCLGTQTADSLGDLECTRSQWPVLQRPGVQGAWGPYCSFTTSQVTALHFPQHLLKVHCSLWYWVAFVCSSLSPVSSLLSDHQVQTAGWHVTGCGV